MPVFTFIKLVDPGALHKLLVQNGFLVSGISYDSGTNTTSVILEEGETKDPTQVVNSYVYSALVGVVTVLAQHDSIIEEE